MFKAANTNTMKRIAPADPIFAAIATHKRLERRWLDMARARDEAGASCPSASEVEHASEAGLAAAWSMARTEPTTVAGTAAMLRYLTKDPTNGLFELGEVIWLETAFRTLERSLAKMGRESRQAEAA